MATFITLCFVFVTVIVFVVVIYMDRDDDNDEITGLKEELKRTGTRALVLMDQRDTWKKQLDKAHEECQRLQAELDALKKHQDESATRNMQLKATFQRRMDELDEILGEAREIVTRSI